MFDVPRILPQSSFNDWREIQNQIVAYLQGKTFIDADVSLNYDPDVAPTTVGVHLAQIDKDNRFWKPISFDNYTEFFGNVSIENFKAGAKPVEFTGESVTNGKMVFEEGSTIKLGTYIPEYYVDVFKIDGEALTFDTTVSFTGPLLNPRFGVDGGDTFRFPTNKGIPSENDILTYKYESSALGGSSLWQPLGSITDAIKTLAIAEYNTAGRTSPIRQVPIGAQIDLVSSLVGNVGDGSILTTSTEDPVWTFDGTDKFTSTADRFRKKFDWSIPSSLDSLRIIWVNLDGHEVNRNGYIEQKKLTLTIDPNRTDTEATADDSELPAWQTPFINLNSGQYNQTDWEDIWGVGTPLATRHFEHHISTEDFISLDPRTGTSENNPPVYQNWGPNVDQLSIDPIEPHLARYIDDNGNAILRRKNLNFVTPTDFVKFRAADFSISNHSYTTLTGYGAIAFDQYQSMIQEFRDTTPDAMNQIVDAYPLDGVSSTTFENTIDPVSPLADLKFLGTSDHAFIDGPFGEYDDDICYINKDKLLTNGVKIVSPIDENGEYVKVHKFYYVRDHVGFNQDSRKRNTGLPYSIRSNDVTDSTHIEFVTPDGVMYTNETGVFKKRFDFDATQHGWYQPEVQIDPDKFYPELQLAFTKEGITNGGEHFFTGTDRNGRYWENLAWTHSQPVSWVRAEKEHDAFDHFDSGCRITYGEHVQHVVETGSSGGMGGSIDLNNIADSTWWYRPYYYVYNKGQIPLWGPGRGNPGYKLWSIFTSNHNVLPLNWNYIEDSGFLENALEVDYPLYDVLDYNEGATKEGATSNPDLFTGFNYFKFKFVPDDQLGGSYLGPCLDQQYCSEADAPYYYIDGVDSGSSYERGVTILTIKGDSVPSGTKVALGKVGGNSGFPELYDQSTMIFDGLSDHTATTDYQRMEFETVTMPYYNKSVNVVADNSPVPPSLYPLKTSATGSAITFDLRYSFLNQLTVLDYKAAPFDIIKFNNGARAFVVPIDFESFALFLIPELSKWKGVIGWDYVGNPDPANDSGCFATFQQVVFSRGFKDLFSSVSVNIDAINALTGDFKLLYMTSDVVTDTSIPFNEKYLIDATEEIMYEVQELELQTGFSSNWETFDIYRGISGYVNFLERPNTLSRLHTIDTYCYGGICGESYRFRKTEQIIGMYGNGIIQYQPGNKLDFNKIGEPFTYFSNGSLRSDMEALNAATNPTIRPDAVTTMNTDPTAGPIVDLLGPDKWNRDLLDGWDIAESEKLTRLYLEELAKGNGLMWWWQERRIGMDGLSLASWGPNVFDPSTVRFTSFKPLESSAFEGRIDQTFMGPDYVYGTIVGTNQLMWYKDDAPDGLKWHAVTNNGNRLYYVNHWKGRGSNIIYFAAFEENTEESKLFVRGNNFILPQGFQNRIITNNYGNDLFPQITCDYGLHGIGMKPEEYPTTQSKIAHDQADSVNLDGSLKNPITRNPLIWDSLQNRNYRNERWNVIDGVNYVSTRIENKTPKVLFRNNLTLAPDLSSIDALGHKRPYTFACTPFLQPTYWGDIPEAEDVDILALNTMTKNLQEIEFDGSPDLIRSIRNYGASTMITCAPLESAFGTEDLPENELWLKFRDTHCEVHVAGYDPRTIYEGTQVEYLPKFERFI